MDNKLKRTIAYSDESYPPMPTKSTLFLEKVYYLAGMAVADA